MDNTKALYNALDTFVTLQIIDTLRPQCVEEGYSQTYRMTLDSYDPLIFMSIRGIRVDSAGIHQAAALARDSAARLRAELNQLAKRDLDPQSPKDCITYFYVEKGITPYLNPKTHKPTVDELALQRLARGTSHRKGYREASIIAEIRKLEKMVGTYLEMKLDDDQRFRSSYNPRGSKYGRLSSSKTVMGTGGNCLLPSAEVLTVSGWKPISSLVAGESILQWSLDGELTWIVPEIVVSYSDYMLRARSEQYQLTCTPNHRLPTYKPGRTTMQVYSASQVSSMTRNLPVGGRLDEFWHCPDLMRLVAMVQADGSIEGNLIRLSFSKERKIDRCLKLLQGLDWTEQSPNNGCRRFCISVGSSHDIIDVLGRTKLFGSWILKLSQESLLAFVDEVGNWDSHRRGDSYQYCTTVEQNAWWLATAAHLCGHSATVRSVGNSYRGGYGSENNKEQWLVNVKPRNYIGVEPKHWTTVDYEGPVYCLTVPSSFFLVRDQGFISVTGNSQNIPEEHQHFFIPDDGYFFIDIDKARAEWVVVAYLAEDEFMIQAHESGLDVHARTAQLMFNESLETILKENRAIGHSTDADSILRIRKEQFPALLENKSLIRTMSMRQAGKKAGHSLNYDEGARQFSLLNEITESEAQRIIDLYLKAYPGVPRYHAWVRDQLRRNRTLENCFGRKIEFKEQWGRDLWKSAYSAIPQSTVVDLVNQAMVSIYRDQSTPGFRSLEILQQVHDSIRFQFPLAMLDHFPDTLERCLERMNPTLHYNGRDFHIGSDVKVGARGSEMKEVHTIEEATAVARSLQQKVQENG